MSLPKLGWVGTGVMGRYMCSHLINAGYPMTVFNRTISKCEPLTNLGAKLARTPKEVGQNSDIIFSIVGHPSDVKQVILDQNDGILQGCKQNNIIVDMTTSEPSLAEEIQQIASSKNVQTLGKCHYFLLKKLLTSKTLTKRCTSFRW